jgi:pyruvate/2-oxoglutarate dehydrogenase complex dihydrolipoamide acyltransferase (E2) component
MGTVAITSVGALARAPGWFVPRSIHNLCLAVGAIVKKPWIVEGRIEPRDILHLTVLFDHDVIDGVPAARFLGRLADSIQAGFPTESAE